MAVFDHSVQVWELYPRVLAKVFLVLLGLSLTSEIEACEDCGEPQDSIQLKYIGSQYLPISVTANGDTLFNRKLVARQSFSLQPRNAKGKKLKQFFVRVGQRNMVLKLGCSSKQYAWHLGDDVFTLRYNASLFKKPPCFVKDDGAAVNLPPSL